MADRIPAQRASGLTTRENDGLGKTETDKNPPGKVVGESTKSDKKPRTAQRESSAEENSANTISDADHTEKSRGDFGKKIKKTWRSVQEKLAGLSVSTHQTDTSSVTKAEASTKKRITLWRLNAQSLLDHADSLRTDFVKSKRRMEVGSDIKKMVIAGHDFSSLSNCTGLGFPFHNIVWTEENVSALEAFGKKSFKEPSSSIERQKHFLSDDADIGEPVKYSVKKPVKLFAHGIGKDRLTEVLKALQEIPLHCPVILDLSSNNLGPAELNQLADVMAVCPVIYHLDLSGNPLCTGEDPSPALDRLFENLGPVSHLYLDHTNFNENTALMIQEALRRNRCLRYLDLQNNNLKENGIVAIIDAVIPSDIGPDFRDESVLATVKLQNNPYTGSPLVNKAFHIAEARCIIPYGDDDIIHPIPFELDGIEEATTDNGKFISQMLGRKNTGAENISFQRL